MSKTALDLTPDQQKQYCPAQRWKEEPETERFRAAWELVPHLATVLREQFGASRVIVFGSLVQSTTFTDWSDIDLAIWGVPPRCFYKAVGLLNELHPEFRVDLVDPESASCRDSVRRAIDEMGIEI
jgi:uncharacterized protein